jgi:hypothetical protein
MDNDLDTMTTEQLKAEVLRLRAGIRQHRDSSGHSLCWYVPELWNLLPEKVKPAPEVPPLTEFLEQCVNYRVSLESAAINKPGRCKTTNAVG